MTTLPTIVLVHGAWSTPPIYDPFVKALRVASYTVHCPLLPTCSSTSSKSSSDAKFSSDVTTVRHLVSSLADASTDVVLLMHSYGGAVGSSAIADLSSKQRAQQGLAGGVVHLLYLSAYILPVGGSVVGIVKKAGYWHLWDQVLDVGQDGSTFPKDPKMLLFGGLAEEKQEVALKSLVRFPAEPLEVEIMQTPWVDIRSTYVYTEQDHAVPIVYQDIMMKRVREAGVEVREERFECGHGVFLTHTEDVVGVVDRAVGRVHI